MLDTEFIRKNPEKVKEVILAGRSDPKKADVDKWLELDKERSTLIVQADELRQQRNELSKGLTGKPDAAIINQVKELKDQLESIESNLSEVQNQWQAIMDWIPNMPISFTAMPKGTSEDDNPIDKIWIPDLGYVYTDEKGDDKHPQTVGNFYTEVPERSKHWDEALREPKHHVDLGEGWLFDLQQGAKVSGTRFKYLINDGAMLEFALQQHLSKELIRRGFKYIVPPLMVKEAALYGTSHIPEGADQIYKLNMDNFEEGNQLYLIGSSEPSNFSYFAGRTLEEEDLPVKVFAYTPCFRSEVGSWGKDVRGIKRVHQFAKIEMNCVCKPEESGDIFNEFLEINEWLLQSLEIPYRLTRKCTGDAGYHASAEQIDPDAWLPAQKEWMEVGTDTNTTDFQARRLNIKVQRKDGKKEFAHTVNDTGCPMERMIISIIDNYQQSNGTVKVPNVLKEYLGKDFLVKE